MITILVAEDDKNVQLLIAARLKSHYQVVCADDGAQALSIVETQHVDLMIADVMMPHLDGFTLVRTLRDRGSTLPILILTARQTPGDKRQGFSSGTDDYMTKPIDYEELQWRIRALLRRSRIFWEQKIEVGAVTLDAVRFTLVTPSGEISLPPKEFDLLHKLLSYPGQIFTKAQLLAEVWGDAFSSGEDTVKTHVSRLRARLEGVGDFSIVTVKGLGYKAEVGGPGGQV